MSIHWTYCDCAPNSDLQQGDIIARDERLLGILKSVHSHFCDDKYVGFLVVTQSCDLVRRKKGLCKAKHFSIATIRELDQVLPEQLKELSGHQQRKCFIQERRTVAEDFLRRLIDQNEQSRGLFYLHPSADAGIAVASLAFLRITIALRREHYDVVRKSRVGRLSPEFANKLGWLVGNLYSRIGTPDWEEQSDSGDGSKLVKQYLEDSAPSQFWVPESWVNEAEKESFDFDRLSDPPLKALARFAPPSAKEIVMREVYKTTVQVRLDTIKEGFKASLVADEQMRQFVIKEIMAKLDPHPEKEVIQERIENDASFWEAVANNIWSLLQRAKSMGSEIDNPLTESVRQSLGTQTMIPPLQNAVRNCFPKESEPIVFRHDDPFPGQLVSERIIELLDANGNVEWNKSLQMIIGRLGNNTILGSIVR